ncbi:MAG: nucleotidyltransferase domain-containing protein [Bacteroidia bacterium]|nr:nucleotidyltransferase domain-containing protein [Bacteroidia bacterium]
MKFGLKDDIILKVNAILISHIEVEQAIIYGSRAKGNFKQGSDIDITLKGENLGLDILNKICREVDDLLLPYTFDISIFKQIKNNDLLDHIERVGIIFYNKPS